MDIEKQTRPSESELSRRQKLARRFLPALALSLAAGGAGAALHEKSEQQDVATVTYKIGEGQTPVEAVREVVDSMQISEDGEPAHVDDVVSEGQEVSRELKQSTGNEFVQPGDEIEVTVSKDGFGNYDVEADPADAKN